MTAVIVDGVQTVNDASTLPTWLSVTAVSFGCAASVSLTSGLGRRNTLYVFEGSPGVEDNAGGEVTVGVGQTVEFAMEGGSRRPLHRSRRRLPRR